MTTTFRQDVTAGLVTILDAFIAANPDMLRRSERVRPPSVIGDLPVAYVDSRAESITHDTQIRTRTMRPSVVVVSAITDNEETVVRHDVLVDALIDHFTASPHLITGTVWEDMSVTDEDFSVETANGDRHFYATRFTFEDVTIQEGRA